MRHLLPCILLFVMAFPATGHAQADLGPRFGPVEEPEDDTPICAIPELVTPNVETHGFHVGNVVDDFSLFTPDGEQVTLSDELDHGVPILLIACSYTCTVFRDRLPQIDALHQIYAGRVRFLLVYTPEAHPVEDISPYFGYVSVGRNLQDDILYRQPTTYGARRRVALDMVGALNVAQRVVIDGPCNEWWWAYGPAANNAYLLDTDGRVVAKHWWFNHIPQNMERDIEDLLEQKTTDAQTESRSAAAGTTIRRQGDVLVVDGPPVSGLNKIELTLCDLLGRTIQRLEFNDLPFQFRWQTKADLGVVLYFIRSKGNVLDSGVLPIAEDKL